MSSVIAEKPLCAECERPLQRSTYFYDFIHKHPNEAETLTSIEDGKRLIPEGHVPTKGRQSFHWAYDTERDFEGRILSRTRTHLWGVNLWDGKSYGSRDGLCGRCAHAPKKSRKKVRQRRLSIQVEFDGELPEDQVLVMLNELPEMFRELSSDGPNHPLGRLISAWIGVHDGQDTIAECRHIVSQDGEAHDTFDVRVADRDYLVRLGYRLGDNISNGD